MQGDPEWHFPVCLGCGGGEPDLALHSTGGKVATEAVGPIEGWSRQYAIQFVQPRALDAVWTMQSEHAVTDSDRGQRDIGRHIAGAAQGLGEALPVPAAIRVECNAQDRVLELDFVRLHRPAEQRRNGELDAEAFGLEEVLGKVRRRIGNSHLAQAEVGGRQQVELDVAVDLHVSADDVLGFLLENAAIAVPVDEMGDRKQRPDDRYDEDGNGNEQVVHGAAPMRPAAPELHACASSRRCTQAKRAQGRVLPQQPMNHSLCGGDEPPTPMPPPRSARVYHTAARKSGQRIWRRHGHFGGIVGRMEGTVARHFRVLYWQGMSSNSKQFFCHRRCRSSAGKLRRGPSSGTGRGSLCGRAQPGAARGRRSAGRPRSGARRRRDGQDAGVDHSHCPYSLHGQGAGLANPCRDLHQQGRARDERAHRCAGRRCCRGHALARNLPCHRRQDPAPPRRARGPQIGLHDPRCGRSGAPPQAGDRERGARQGPLAGAPARRPHRRLEEPRSYPRQGAARRGVRFCRGQRGGALRGLSEAPQGAERRRLRRPAAGGAAAVPGERGRSGGLPAQVPLHPGR